MADNLTIPASGTGTATPVVATDDVSSVHYQKIKVDLGGDGVSLPLVGVDETGASAVDTLPVGGGTPHDSVDSGHPVKIGGKAASTTPSAVAAGDRVNAWFDITGALRVILAAVDGSNIDAVNPLFTQLVNGSGNEAGTDTDPLVTQPQDSAGNNIRQTAGTATLANVAASASSVTLQASNTARIGLIIVNDSTVSCYVKYGSAASTSSYTYKLGPGGILECGPAGFIYTGIVTGIWDSATGNARMTELT